MVESNFAKWLDLTFSGFDGSILEFYHKLAEWAVLCNAIEELPYAKELILVKSESAE